METQRLSRFELIFLIASAAVTITFVSVCSPLYPFNPWDDIHCFYTLGRGIIHGLVPYRDLYEQKGPLLYFVYALAALISEKSLVGAWVVEAAVSSVFAVFSWKITKLFVKPSGFTIVIVPLFLGIIYTSGMFNFGGNAEELCFPMLTVALYFGLKAIRNGDGLPSGKEAVICGEMTAALFWVKYTFTGFMAGFCLYIIVTSIIHKDFKKLWSLVWRFLAGFLMITIPILIYFLANGALSSLWEAYFYNNFHYYHSGIEAGGLANIPVVKYIYIPLACIVSLTKDYPSFGIMLLLSALSVFLTGREKLKATALFFFITLALSAGFIFTRPVIIYYYGYLLTYCNCLLLVPCVKALNRIEKMWTKDPMGIRVLLTSALVVLYVFSIFLCKNLYLIFKPRDFVPQVRIAETIKQTPDAKVLTYDVMDAGIYAAAEVLPQNRFFCYLNIEKSYPALLEEQDRLISEGYFDYIVTTFFCEPDWDNYELVQEETGAYVDYTGIEILDGYRLYKRI